MSVSDATQSILAASFPASRLTRLTSISTTQLAATFGSASAYLALTVSEGFGFPYVEAAYMGCDVIAPRQAITTELLGEDACLLATSTPTPDELLVALESWDAARIERLQTRATSRTWDTTARQVAHVVRDVARAM